MRLFSNADSSMYEWIKAENLQSSRHTAMPFDRFVYLAEVGYNLHAYPRARVYWWFVQPEKQHLTDIALADRFVCLFV